MRIKENVLLGQYNTFNINATARYFVTIDSIAALRAILSNKKYKTIPYVILGGGSNILFTRDVEGLVIHNQIVGVEKIDENNDHVFLKIGAGENWHQLVLYCVKNNYAGIENLSLIPGTVGAAPIQNIGAYGVELKETLCEVHAIDIEKNTPRIFKNAECEFGYRDSIFKKTLKNKFIITHVVLRLYKKPIFHLEYGAIKEKLKGKNISIKSMSDTIIQIRQEKLPDPKKIPNAGSFFKNPIISEALFLSLQKKHPDMPYFQEKNSHVKIPAAWLIEQCGFKGKRFGKVGVHANQALVLVNYDHGTGAEIKKLSEDIQKNVFDKFNIILQTEVNIF
ncbi:MAG: hypothetical protein ACD_42C00318G0002 [uncultured bacterium]|nr:MAG: hypothetical protein ACD_42C00318G0002 [uncultured bacterium]OGT32684.1 MAG: UDP-N-acetylenolpyruvoylglucosamine reductase [Gammaproteobacteria bacterium RIFCSPHIGHO2_02_FULL_39_13]OGT48648.1 MAG: UDP-N-acetylenolpyruvoylglucosamine reductase [Gammaproteobacteria bacterium RIFCSPHIGHO2_12_FULL_39_24]